MAFVCPVRQVLTPPTTALAMAPTPQTVAVAFVGARARQMLVFLYISAVTLIFGAEINSALRRASDSAARPPDETAGDR